MHVLRSLQRIGVVGMLGALAASAASTASTACATFGGQPPRESRIEDRDSEGNAESRWHVVFASPSAPGVPAPMSGWASMRSGGTRASTSILLNVTGATPGAVHPWELHHGRCGADQGIYGPASAYAPLTMDSTGRGAGPAIVKMPMPTEGPFFVRIARSAADPRATVACGDLVAPTAP